MLRFDHKILAALVFVAMLPLKGVASSPGMIEGPSGCTWNASVVRVQDTQITLRLNAIYGACMQDPSPCGKEGDTIEAKLTVAQNSVEIGSTVQVWVDATGATFSPPTCTSRPIAP
jgi:hypothetical protein